MQNTSPASRPRLRLADHVRACSADGQVILLDLKKGRYVGVGGTRLLPLARAVEGWPAQGGANGPAEPADIDALTAPLRAQGLLTDAPATVSPAVAGLEEPIGSLNAEDTMADASVGWRRVRRFVHSTATASLWLRYRSLATIACIVAARRASLQPRDDPAAMEATRDLVSAYLRLRPFAFTAHDRCLHDSLTVIHFLTAEGVWANWVIGVRTQPFGAHSWVQCGPIVLNDQHEHVRRYQPILVV